MIWEWERGQWVVTVGIWHAVVQRVTGSRPIWQATIERTTPSPERYESRRYTDAMDARTWCLRTIAELAGTIV